MTKKQADAFTGAINGIRVNFLFEIIGNTEGNIVKFHVI